MKTQVTTYICDACGGTNVSKESYYTPADWIIFSIKTQQDVDFHFCQPCGKELISNETGSILKRTISKIMGIYK